MRWTQILALLILSTLVVEIVNPSSNFVREGYQVSQLQQSTLSSHVSVHSKVKSKLDQKSLAGSASFLDDALVGNSIHAEDWDAASALPESYQSFDPLCAVMRHEVLNILFTIVFHAPEILHPPMVLV